MFFFFLGVVSIVFETAWRRLLSKWLACVQCHFCAKICNHKLTWGSDRRRRMVVGVRLVGSRALEIYCCIKFTIHCCFDQCLITRKSVFEFDESKLEEDASHCSCCSRWRNGKLQHARVSIPLAASYEYVASNKTRQICAACASAATMLDFISSCRWHTK